MEAVFGLLVMLLGVSHAPVSSVLMDSECLSQGEMKVSCSSEGGDSPQYSWTLGGRALTDAELYSANKEENSITLKQHVSGRVACKVWNHVSSVSKEEDIMNCATDALPITAGVLSALVIFLVVGVAVTCALKKKKNNKPKEGEDDQEVTYADVRIVQRQQRQVEQREKVEVEYGQVKFSGRPRQTQPAGEDCLYANVRKGR
ncbi:cell surface A33 antigen-like [Embiotoca jacksoni]|uniref:cell surface A33 antigen-like n=1 Tax=Embiotoca jacksoni TaxID=100190 RepID=UPI0037039AAB